MLNVSAATEREGSNGGMLLQVGTDRLAGWAIAAVGMVLVALTVVHWVVYDPTLFATVVVTIPGFVVVAGWLWIRRGQIPTDSYPLVLRWTLQGFAVLGGFILVVVLIQGGSFVDSIPLVLFMAGTGAVAGVLVGNASAQNAIVERQARALREEQQRLVFLNHLLRHNVLNKVSIIKGNATTAANELEGGDRYLETIESHSSDVAELVENVRILVNATTSEPDLQPIDVSVALRREVEAIRQSVETLELETDIESGLTARADDLVRYVFENVLHNAIEHNDSDRPQLTVEARRRGEDVEVSITDNGPGIPETQKQAAFEPEMTGDHGVGLYLVSTFVSQYGGEVSIEDNEPRGTTFTIRLPAAA